MIARTFTTESNLAVWFLALSLCLNSLCISGQAIGQTRHDQPNDNEVNIRLRVSWGGGSPRIWRGNIHFHEATISDPIVLGMNIESPAALELQQHAIRVKQLSESTFEGVDIEVQGDLESQISIQLAEPGLPAKKFQLTLAEIIEQTRVYPLDDSNNRISFERVSGDQIRVLSDRDHMIFAAGEVFEFRLQANNAAGSGRDTECRIELVKTESNQVVSNTTISLPCNGLGTSEQIKQLFAVPQTEGVYEVRFVLENAVKDMGLIPTRKRLAARSIQFVVLQDQPFARKEFIWSPVLEFQPDDFRSTISQQVNHLSRLVGVGGKSGAIGKFSVSKAPNSRIELPVGGWQSITLDIDDPNVKHLIELDYDSGDPMSLGLSVLVPNADGSVSNFGFDSGFQVADTVVSISDPADSVHRFTFQPDTKRVVLLIANRDSRRPAQFSRIRLLKQTESDIQTVKSITDIGNASFQHRRMMAIYEQPLFAENFGVVSPTDASTLQPVSDWRTFYEGAKRLVFHLRDIGASGAIINVVGEGSSLAPLTTLQGSPRYDTGVFSTTVNECMKKDVVELLYRIFERENLRFTPLLTFDHPMSSVEFMNAADAVPVDYRGLLRTATEYDLPRYNPLSPVVQSSVNSVIEEFTKRYSHRVGYHGIALACRPDTCTLLPGSRNAGYDQKTVERFQQDQAIASPPLTGNELLSAEHFESWLNWRGEQMSTWYKQVAKICTQGNREARLYLAPIDITRNEEFASIVSPALHHSPDINQTMLRMGLSNELTSKRNKIVLMKPHRFAPVHPLSSQKCDFEMQNNSQFAEWFGQQQESVSLFYNRSAWARFENLENSSLFGKDPEPIMRLQQLSQAGRWSCQPLAQAVWENDSAVLVDGGLLLHTTVNDYRTQFLKVFAQLTSEKFENAKHATHTNERHPVAVRYLNTDRGTEIYLVNSSPWQIEVTIKSNMVVTKGLQNFAQRDWIPINDSHLPNEIQVVLKPFELVAGRSADNRLKLNEFSYKLPESAQRELNACYYKLRSKLIASGKAQPLNWLSNAGFEQQSLAGWTIGSQEQEFAFIDSTGHSADGNSFLRIRNNSKRNTWIRSDVIPVPETGRLSISVWLKLGEQQQQPPLRISVESDDPKSNYYRFAEVGSLNADSASSQLSIDWRQFAVHFDDLPQQPLNGLRIGFDLIGEGEVWVDHVQIFDRWLDDNDAKAVTQLLASIGPLLNQTETLERCRTILTSYWPTFLRQYFQDENESVNVAEVHGQPVRSTMRQRFRRFVSPGIFQFR